MSNNTINKAAWQSTLAACRAWNMEMLNRYYEKMQRFEAWRKAHGKSSNERKS